MSLLSSSLDGSVTYGTNPLAMFPAGQPTLTSPPYSTQAFPLYMKPKSELYDDVAMAVIRSVGQPATPLNTAFFSKDNVTALQMALIDRIRQSLGLVLDRQSDWEMMLMMRQVYLDSADNWPTDVNAEVSRLNSMVLQLAAQAVSTNVTQYMAYSTDVNVPIAALTPAESLTMAPLDTGTPASVQFGFEDQRAQDIASLGTLGPKDETMNTFPPAPSPQNQQAQQNQQNQDIASLGTLGPQNETLNTVPPASKEGYSAFVDFPSSFMPGEPRQVSRDWRVV